MGITISVTMPKPLEQEFSKRAKEAGMSRSAFIRNILLKWDEKMKQPTRARSLQEMTSGEIKPNNCYNRDDDGFCNVFEHVCNAPQSEAVTCVGYHKDKNRGK